MDTKIIGSKIVQARKKANMSQAQLAQLLFISPQAVGKWERGESVPDIITFNRLAEILSVDLNYFSENFPSAGNETNLAATDDSNNAPEESLQENTEAAIPGQQLLTNFNGSNLTKSDFAGVTAHKMKFKASALFGSDFSGADLTGSTFDTCDAREANFDSANLADCNFSITDLTDASFSKATIQGTTFNTSGQGANFTDLNFADAKFTKTDLRKTIFGNCSFNNVDFNNCDLRGVSFEGQTFNNVTFDMSALNDASFIDATLKNVSFRASFAITNKFYKALKTIHFDGAKMDKLTYAALKGLGAELAGVTLI
ncbi:MAG: pentapeptide repeat-containing protein [Bacteroidetes bacterium]|nr:pentapeptide repeat-containing protein [Bacteroidota bacterium]